MDFNMSIGDTLYFSTPNDFILTEIESVEYFDGSLRKRLHFMRDGSTTYHLVEALATFRVIPFPLILLSGCRRNATLYMARLSTPFC